MEEQNPTPGNEGASTLDRLERYLAAQDAPEQTASHPEQSDEPARAAPQVEPDDGDQEQESQPQQFSTSDVAKWLGVDESTLDVDEDGTIKVKTKIDGQEGAAKFADLLKNYQIQGHAENKAREVAERERAIQARAQEVEQQAQQRLQHLEQLATVASQELMREYQSIDWNALRQADPGQYAALRADFQERNAKLQGVYQNIQQQNAQREAQAERSRAEALAREAERLPSLIPEWKDDATKARESRELMEWGQKIGYAPEVLQRLNTSTALDIATFRKAMLYDKLQSSKPDVENKVRTAPKLVKPGQTQAQSAAQKLSNLKQAVKKSGGNQDAVAAYLLAKGIA